MIVIFWEMSFLGGNRIGFVPSTKTEAASKGKLQCWYANANSLRNKLNEFHTCIDTEMPDIIGVAEI